MIQIMIQHVNAADHRLFNIVSNWGLFDANGKLVEFSKPVLHSMNKARILDQEKMQREFRPNVIVLGDITDDTFMVHRTGARNAE